MDDTDSLLNDSILPKDLLDKTVEAVYDIRNDLSLRQSLDRMYLLVLLAYQKGKNDA